MGKLDTINEVYVPVIVEGELRFGAYRSADPEKHMAQINSFLLNCKILPTDSNTADIYGNIKSVLIKNGKPIPENDIWIGALALQHNLPLYTTDNHFAEIANITFVE